MNGRSTPRLEILLMPPIQHLDGGGASEHRTLEHSPVDLLLQSAACEDRRMIWVVRRDDVRHVHATESRESSHTLE